MAATINLRQGLRQSLQAKTTQTTDFSLYDLSHAFFSSQKLSTNDSLREYLQSQTGLTTTQSLTDLWRQFFIGKGIANLVSLQDMANLFFVNVGF